MRSPTPACTAGPQRPKPSSIQRDLEFNDTAITSAHGDTESCGPRIRWAQLHRSGSVGYGQAFTDSIGGDWGGKPLVDWSRIEATDRGQALNIKFAASEPPDDLARGP
jgi:hypothetical protein